MAKKVNAEDELLKAVAKWVESKGGNVIVAGGIQIITWPDDDEFKFTVGVRCTGRKPITEAANAEIR